MDKMGRDEDQYGEANPLLPTSTKQEASSSKAPKVITALVFGSVLLFSGKFALNGQQSTETGLTSSTSTLTFSIDNDGYGQPSTVQTGFYSEIGAIVEPHKSSTFSLIEPVGSNFEWTIAEDVSAASVDNSLFDDKAFAGQKDQTFVAANELKPVFDMKGAMVLSSSETSVVHKFGAVAGKRYLISAKCAETGEVASMVVHGRYVRRELRALNLADRELYLSAMHEVYVLSSKEGKAKYGEKFEGHDYYGHFHLGADQFNHPWHSEPSFFPAHAAFSHVFEQSMQMIHPSVALAYWDYLIDAEKYKDVRQFKNGWAESEVWSEDFFGPMPLSEDGLFETKEISNTKKRLSGRWTDITLQLDFTTYAGIDEYWKVGAPYNSYGLSRDSYNNNPATSITRSFEICGLKTVSTKLSGCYELKKALATTHMSEFIWTVEGGMHNLFHAQIGGAWECGVNLREVMHKVEVLGSDATAVVNAIAMNFHNSWRTLYYDGLLVKDDHCSLATDFTDCQLRCEELESEFEALDGGAAGYSGHWYGIDPQADTLTPDRWDHYFRTHVINKMGKYVPEALTYDIDEETGYYYFTKVDKTNHDLQTMLKAALVTGSCRPGKVGEFCSPLASAQDPMFFPLHTNFERVWQYMRIVKNLDSRWGSVLSQQTSSWDDDGKFVPVGWEFDDPMYPFDDVYGVKRTSGTYYTNRELIALFNPSKVDYIYDDQTYSVCGISDA